MTGDLTEENGEEYYGDWLVISVPDGKLRIPIWDQDTVNACERNTRVRKMMEAIAEFVRQHQADW